MERIQFYIVLFNKNFIYCFIIFACNSEPGKFPPYPVYIYIDGWMDLDVKRYYNYLRLILYYF